jgi:hypothetical protein
MIVRHGFDREQGVGSRMVHDVKFSEELTIETESTPGKMVPKTYDLVAVCHHGGGEGLDHGHYRAMCKIIPENSRDVCDARARR